MMTKKQFLSVSTAIICLLQIHSSHAQNVGIDVNAPQEKLAIDGAIIIDESSSSTPQPGTIEYKDSLFRGFTSEGWKPLSEHYSIRTTYNTLSDTITFFEKNSPDLIVELGPDFPAGTTVPLDHNHVRDLCADDDGCEISVLLKDFDTFGSVFFEKEGYTYTKLSADNGGFYYSRESFGPQGADHLGGSNTLLLVGSSCLLSDGKYDSYANLGDNEPGLNFAKWTSTNNTDRSCIVRISD